MLHQLLKPAIIIFCFALPAWLILRIAIIKKKRKHAATKKEILLFLFYVYIICVLMITLFPIPMTRYADPHFNRINLIPIIKTWKEYMLTVHNGETANTNNWLKNIIGNIILFFPLGVLLPGIIQLISLKKLVLIAFLFSFCIESAQFISTQFGVYRSVDIDDIILNIAGACMGFVIIKTVFLKRIG
jgi:glycopeptide antibiotics resistance protein